MTGHDDGGLAVLKASEMMVASPRLPSMKAEAIEKVRALEALSLSMCEQVEFSTEHVIHGGMYARTLHMAAGTLLTGALLTIPTILIVSGDCSVFIGEETIELRGYAVLPGSAGRKQAFMAHTDVSMTMFFPTTAKTVAEAEREFTDEYDMLMTNRQDCATTLITGE